MRLPFLVLSFLIASHLSCIERPEYPFPLSTKPRISGTFTEFRRNHLHRGLDVRTFAQNGLRVHSLASGWVKALHASNINAGFGQALYIQHKDGFSSVFGHLLQYSNLHQLQAAFELYQQMIPSDYFMIKMPEKWLNLNQGAWVANTGDKGSGVSHLHYEVHSPAGDYLNPFPSKQYGNVDTTAPVIMSVYVHQLNHTTDGQQTHHCKVQLVQKNFYECEGAPILVDGFFGLKTGVQDSLNAINIVAIYKADVFVDGKRVFFIELDAMHPEDSPRNFVLLDRYRTKFSPPVYTYNLYEQPDLETLPLYVKEQKNNGWVDTSDMKDDETKTVKIILSDISGNASSVQFTVQKTQGQLIVPEKTTPLYNLQAKRKLQKRYKKLVVSGKLKSQAYLKVTRKKSKRHAGLRPRTHEYSVKFVPSNSKDDLLACIRISRGAKRGLYDGSGNLISSTYNKQHKGYCTMLRWSKTLVVADDTLHPTIGLPYAYGPLTQTQFQINVADHGSGIDRSKIDLWLAGNLLSDEEKKRVGLYYDHDRRAFVMNTGFSPDASQHQDGELIPLQAQVYDRAGNKSSLFHGFVLIPR